MRIEGPFDWIPQVFRTMLYQDYDGVIYRLDYSVPGGQWVPVESKPREPQQLPLVDP